ncbi:MAG TPA: hypothetical protein VGQ76_09555 [Thermoanaerobaculia bacterium]|jgi:hypothetical protein|nr:hypothetical protein [Thermoanaerobaculia bacterium]
MKKSKWLWAAAVLLPLMPIAVVRNSRSVRQFPQRAGHAIHGFDREQSVALFVGVPRFTHDKSLAPVRDAADDGVDLASAVALDPNAVNLVPPKRVTIALSGLPHKQSSKDRLNALKAAGARVVMEASQSDLLMLLRDQAVLAGRMDSSSLP